MQRFIASGGEVICFSADQTVTTVPGVNVIPVKSCSYPHALPVRRGVEDYSVSTLYTKTQITWVVIVDVKQNIPNFYKLFHALPLSGAV